MLKDYVIVDNVLREPELLVDLSRSIKYYTNEKKIAKGIQATLIEESLQPLSGYWRGYRSELLSIINKDLFLKINSNILEKAFHHNNFSYYIDSFLNLNDQSIPYYDGWWHTDGGLIAGVIYLNENAPPNTGTLIKHNGTIINIENKFNRLVMYRTNLVHRPAGFFGDSLETARSTFTFFINELTLTSNNQ
ncbi:hypothetical protein UFOVP242_6 [uncultured Caudovirales phage]|uniref:Uncharacterized protein n=1 Tax=uncultured Caudovirales phage TaxID=2100421 RepID=A0A6J7WUI9_9CAUD|nr:hypothetical protein UFOVP242_6 [uncultured Caudovirales phage]